MKASAIRKLAKSRTRGELEAGAEAIAERESIYRILGQTTPENTCKDFNSYTVDPITRYHRTMNRKLVSPYQIASLVDTDNPAAVSLSADVTVS